MSFLYIVSISCKSVNHFLYGPGTGFKLTNQQLKLPYTMQGKVIFFKFHDFIFSGAIKQIEKLRVF